LKQRGDFRTGTASLNADAIYLYSIGALFLFPQTAASILNMVADLAVRFDWNRYLESVLSH